MITIIITIVLVGVGLLLIERLIKMDSDVKLILRVVVLLCLVLWLLRVFGVDDAFNRIKP